MTPSFETAIHVAHGDSAAVSLRDLGAGRVVVRRDLLTVGPCDGDPARHRALRQTYWGRLPDATPGLAGVDADEDLARELAGSERVVIWATKAWSDLTFLWALVDAMARLGLARPFIVRPVADDDTMSTGGVAPARLRAAFDGVTPLDEATGKSCVAFWRAYTDASPLAFDQLRLRGAALVPELERMLAGHAAWFPWRDGDRVRLADGDAAIFRWAETQRLDEVTRILHWIGDSSLFARTREWQTRGALAGSDRQPTLTDRGRALVADGAASVAELPPLHVGGCRVNDPASPWLRLRSPAGGWQLARAA